MKKLHIFFGLAGLAVAFYGIGQYGTNAPCYEIIPPQGSFDTMLLDKCKGQVFLPVKEDVDTNEDGKIDGYSYRWVAMKSYRDGEVVWEERK